MSDAVVAAVFVGFALSAWGLAVLCDRLMEHRR